MRVILPALWFLLLAGAARAGGVTGRGGLEAVAVSPDGKRLAVGGQNRVVYLLDADTLEVTKRVGLAARVGRLAYTADGKRLLVEDETDTLHLLDAATGKALARRAEVAGLTRAPSGGLVAVRDTAEPAANRLFFLDDDKLAEKGRAELPHRPIAWTFDGGKRLVVFEGSRDNDEKRVPLSDVPRELAGLQRQAYRLRNDGLGAALAVVEVPSGKVTRTTKLWYSSDSDSTALARVGEVTYVYTRGNLCARVAADGATTLFETPRSVNQAVAMSADGKQLWTGGLARGTVGPADGGKQAEFELPALAGQAEMVTAFAPHAGRAWAVTSAFRVARVGKDGKVEKVAAVF